MIPNVGLPAHALSRLAFDALCKPIGSIPYQVSVLQVRASTSTFPHLVISTLFQHSRRPVFVIEHPPRSEAALENAKH
jgi:hypothetical protein